MATFVGRLVAVDGLAALLAAQAPVPASHAAPSVAVYVVTRTDDPPPDG